MLPYKIQLHTTFCNQGSYNAAVVFVYLSQTIRCHSVIFLWHYYVFEFLGKLTSFLTDQAISILCFFLLWHQELFVDAMHLGLCHLQFWLISWFAFFMGVGF
jgi:hypothetical protein